MAVPKNTDTDTFSVNKYATNTVENLAARLKPSEPGSTEPDLP
jgi:hypothetical protein